MSGVKSVALPLSALLSQTLVAFTIEFDNEAERQLQARTDGRRFLVSLVMWYNCMRYVGERAIAPDELLQRAAAVGPTAADGSQSNRDFAADYRSVCAPFLSRC